ALPRLRKAAAAGGEDHRRGVDHVLAGVGAPAVLAALELVQRALREERQPAALGGLPERGRDRVARPVADLEQALRRRAAAAREPIAAVLFRELDAELLEPVDRGGRLGGQDLDQPEICRLMTRAPDVLGVLIRGVVLAERGLDAALRLRGVAGLDRALGRECDAGIRVLGRDGGGEA